MKYTGERHLPWEKNAQANYEHYHRYAIALKFAKNKRVLDLASGEGYGAALLASAARDVTGIDIDEETVSHASNRYTQNNLRFVKGAIQDMPFPDKAFDLVTCFEAIEHVGEQEKVLDEARRLLTDEGLFVISTPNKSLFTDETGQTWPWHVKEFYYSEFQHLLRSKFNDVLFLGQKLLNGSIAWPLDFVGVERWVDNDFYIQTSNENVNFVTLNQQKPMFFIAIASKQNLNEIREKININHLVDVSLELLNEKNFWIDKLKDDVKTLDQMVREKESHLVSLNQTMETRDGLMQELQNDIQSRNAIISHKEAEIIFLNGFIQQKEHDLQIAASALESIHNDIGWRLASRYRTLLSSLAPDGSLRRRLLGLPAKIHKYFQKTPPGAVNPLLPEPAVAENEHVLNSSDSMAICTIASKNYISLVRIFATSVAASNPGVPIFVLLVDQPDGYINPAEEPYHLVTLEQLDNIPDPGHFFFKYTPIELNTAVKPYFLEHLQDKYHFQKICYFDPDVYVFSKLDGLWQLLESSSLVLTPHITMPYQDDHHPTEMDINLAGVFNLGFIGISNTPATRKFLSWWQQRLYDYCYMKPSEGMHVDQNWVNFAPVMHDAVFILRDHAYNIAYWNLHERGTRLRFENANLFLDDRPAVFFHFSGFNPDLPETISIHQSRFSLSDLPNVRPIYEFYRALLQKFEHGRIKKWPYAYGKFDNGVPIANIMRGLYGKQSSKQILKFGNPFSTDERDSFFSWMNEPVDGLGFKHERPIITRLQMEMYNWRADLQRAFPDPLGQDRIHFHQWLLQNGARDFAVDDVFFQGIAPGRDRWMDALLFKARHFYLKSYHGLKAKISRRLSNTWFFPRLLHLNKKYLKEVFDPAAVVVPPFNTPHKSKTILPFGVNIAGYLQGEFGVGEIARASFKSLTAAGVPCELNNVEGYIHRHEDKTLENFSSDNPYSFNLVHVNADQAPVFANLRGEAYFKQRHNIAWWFWELSTFPRSWQSSFNHYQEIWVASGFCQESISARAPIPVVKITPPVLIDPAKVKPDRKRLGLPQDKFIYGFVFDYMSFFERKNPLAIINAFKLAFGDREDVLLLIKTINGNQVPEQVQQLHQAARGSTIQFIDGYLARDDVINLVSSVDSYVSLHRSEGLGISMAQAMYLKKPVIATGYSGNMEFMNHNNSFLVRYQLTEIQENHGPYTKGQHWAEPDVEHAAELMRLVFDDQTHAQKIAERAEADIKTNMTPEVTGHAMKERLLLALK